MNTENAPAMPALEVLQSRIEAQRHRIFQASGMVSCCRHAVPNDTPIGQPDLPRALDLVEDLLNDIAGELEVMLEPKPTREEEFDAVIKATAEEVQS